MVGLTRGGAPSRPGADPGGGRGQAAGGAAGRGPPSRGAVLRPDGQLDAGDAAQAGDAPEV